MAIDCSCKSRSIALRAFLFRYWCAIHEVARWPVGPQPNDEILTDKRISDKRTSFLIAVILGGQYPDFSFNLELFTHYFTFILNKVLWLKQLNSQHFW